MSVSFRKIQSIVAGAALVLVGALAAGTWFRAESAGVGDQEKLIRTEKLPNVPGKSITAIVVSYPPGGKSGPYIITPEASWLMYSRGTIRSEITATGPVKVYKAGESFFEPPGSSPLVSENASAKEPASLLAVFVADNCRAS